MYRALHTLLMLRDRTMAYTIGSAWRWAGIEVKAYDIVSAVSALAILLVAYGVVSD